LKIASTELTKSSANWEVALSRDVRLPALVSLLKAGHLLLFELLQYNYGLSAGGHFVGSDILGKFFLANSVSPKDVVTQRGRSHFTEFVNMVRPIELAPKELSGTLTDGMVYFCGSSLPPWGVIVVLGIGSTRHAVLLPFLENAEGASDFMSFLRRPSSTLVVRAAQLQKESWTVERSTSTFHWPEANFD
jgi:hypothetical protein